MKALTICQPYSHLIVTPQEELPAGEVRKRVENRTWAVQYRGPLLIHAGKSKKYMQPGDRERFGPMAMGALVGIAELVEIVVKWPPPASTSCKVEANYWARVSERFPWLWMHPHAEGPYCWILENVRRFDEPVPYKGGLGLLEVPADILTNRPRVG